MVKLSNSNLGVKKKVPTPVEFVSGTPRSMWLKLRNDDALARMQEKLNVYGESARSIGDTFAEKPRERTYYCVRWTDNFFYRGVVCKIVAEDLYRIRFVDYGNYEEESASDIFPLPKEFEPEHRDRTMVSSTKGFPPLPEQTVRCCLEGYENVSPPDDMSPDNSKLFGGLFNYRRLDAVFERNINSIVAADLATGPPKYSAALTVSFDVGDFVRRSGLMGGRKPAAKDARGTMTGKGDAKTLEVNENGADRCPSPIRPDLVEEANAKVAEWLNRNGKGGGESKKLRKGDGASGSEYLSSNSADEGDLRPLAVVKPTLSGKDDSLPFTLCSRGVESLKCFYVLLSACEKDFLEQHREMRTFYERDAGSSPPDDVGVGTFVAVCHEDQWARAEVLAKTSRGFQLRLVDSGEKAEFSLSELRPLAERFRRLPKLALPCSLNNVDAVNEEAALKKFCEILGENEVYGQPQLLWENDDDFQKLPVPVHVYVPFKKGKGNGGEFASLLLVEDGVATNAHEKPPNAGSDRIDDWNPMEEDFAGRSVDPLEILKKDQKRDGPRTCKFFATNGKCRAGVNCERLHVYMGDSFGDHQRKEVNGVMENAVSIPPEGSVVVMEVTCVRNPGHFYAVLPLGNCGFELNEDMDKAHSKNAKDCRFDLGTLQAEMATYFNRNLVPTGDCFSCGEVVAARYNHDERWYRARLLHSIDVDGPNDARVGVFFVDFGQTHECALADVRKLDVDDFKVLPHQAIECCLDAVEPVSGSWSMACGQRLWELVLKKQLIAKVNYRFANDRVSVELYMDEGNERRSVASVLINEALVKTCANSRQGLKRRGNVVCMPG